MQKTPTNTLLLKEFETLELVEELRRRNLAVQSKMTEDEAAVEIVTMIALDTNAVLDEINERSGLDDEFMELSSKIKPKHINEALRTISPSDAFYQAFDDLRTTVIEYAAELTEKENPL